MKFNEQYTVENHILKFLREKLGYLYIPPEEFAELREFEREYIITDHLYDAISRINGIKRESALTRLIANQVKTADTNENFLNILRSGVNVKDPETNELKDFKIIDFENPENNSFVVTNQFYFEGNGENIRPDILIFINGIPVVDTEAKSPTAGGVSFEDGIGQIKRYEKHARNLFLPNCFNIATNGLKTVYGATYAPKQSFFVWRDDELEKQLGGNLEMTLLSLLEPSHLLDLIQNFIVFEKTDDGVIKKIARYQQVRATNKIYGRFADDKDKRGLIWHTQGSGKSLTMFFTAWKLRYGQYKNRALANPKVLVLVDRVDLDDQIFEVFMNCGGKNVVDVKSREHLLDVVNSNDAGIFISTMQKFDENVRNVKNEAKNIAILIDEAHRTQYGDMGIYLRNALPNALLIGFTGTPIEKTHKEFGLLMESNPERYLDWYSIKQSIDDNATVPVTYEARLSKFAINEKAIDEQFDLLTADLSVEEKQALIGKFGRKEALIKLPKRMKAVAQDIYEHYMAYVAPNGFKAQVVCYDREATARYKEIFDGMMPKEYSEVIYSPGDANKGDDELRKYVKSKKEIKDIVDRFKNPNDPLKFLLVCDMLLTGFDAPVEQVMYIDKPLWGHNLLQAIARTNRTEKNKNYGKIVDYYGVTNNLVEALDFDERDIDEALTNISRLKEEFVKTFNDISALFEGINTENPSMENLRACFLLFRDNPEKRQEFNDSFKKLRALYELLSPDKFLIEYLRKLEWFACFYVAFQKEFDESLLKISVHQLVDEYGAKLKDLIQDKIDYEGITRNYREMRIDHMAEATGKYAEDDETKARNLERVLKSEISINIDAHPIFRSFATRLEEVRKEFETHQISLLDEIKKYESLVEDIKKANDKARDFGLNLKEYALYGFSEEYLKEKTKGALREYAKELSEYLDSTLDPLWQGDSRREDFLKDIKQTIQRLVLQDYKEKLSVEEFPRYLNRLVDIILKKWV